MTNVLLPSTAALLGVRDSGIPGMPNPARGSVRLSCTPTQAPSTFLRGRLSSSEGSRVWLVQAATFDALTANASGGGGVADTGPSLSLNPIGRRR